MAYKVKITKQFEDDLDDILTYISQSLHNPSAQKVLLEKVNEVIINIEKFPFIYPIYHNEIIAQKGYRYATVKNYLIFYTVNDDTDVITISRFLYGKQNITNLL